MKGKSIKHTVIRNSNQMFCTICNKFEVLEFPLAIEEIIKKIDDFNLKHKNCKNENTTTRGHCNS